MTRPLLAFVLLLALPACHSLMCQIEAGPHATGSDISECEAEPERRAEAKRDERARLARLRGAGRP